MNKNNWRNKPTSFPKPHIVKLSQQLACGGCSKITTIDSKYTCRVCGMMLCGTCGEYCTRHTPKEMEITE